ncbi:helix-turn-helix transcriptional regulator [Patulibacter minatonensis]|uniref:helix-turn-helix transcriptional regulator n=1 Tax=Patulibacter minatonensis TaxID=298163 RepID=UPI00047A5282|nr:helix-turn-helix transcriptional regulator [Patulibacter minatonensis]
MPGSEPVVPLAAVAVGTPSAARGRSAPTWDERELRALRRRLHSVRTVPELFALAVQEAASSCGFDRAAVLCVERGLLSVDPAVLRLVDATARDLMGPATDRQIRLGPESAEAELIRAAEADRAVRQSKGSDLRRLLLLDEFVVMPILPESRVVALLVVDRAEGEVGEDERATIALFTHVLTSALEHIVLRTRLSDLSRELQHLTASANALMHEATGAPITALSTPGRVALFVDVGHGDASRSATDFLTDREREIAILMSAGRSNPEIGQELFMSTDTVKDHVGRLVRKLGASNRVEAVARFVAMYRDVA